MYKIISLQARVALFCVIVLVGLSQAGASRLRKCFFVLIFRRWLDSWNWRFKGFISFFIFPSLFFLNAVVRELFPDGRRLAFLFRRLRLVYVSQRRLDRCGIDHPLHAKLHTNSLIHLSKYACCASVFGRFPYLTKALVKRPLLAIDNTFILTRAPIINSSLPAVRFLSASTFWVVFLAFSLSDRPDISYM